jgi:hypothetical protein
MENGMRMTLDAPFNNPGPKNLAFQSTSCSLYFPQQDGHMDVPFVLKTKESKRLERTCRDVHTEKGSRRHFNHNTSVKKVLSELLIGIRFGELNAGV